MNTPPAWATIDHAIAMCNELDTPLGCALAVALEAMGGWGDFTADDFEEFLVLEQERQIDAYLDYEVTYEEETDGLESV